MNTHTYTQYLLALDVDEKQPGLSRLLSAMSVVAKEVSGALSMGSLIVGPPTEDSDSIRSEVVDEVTRTFVDSLIAETAFIRQLAAISIEGEPELIQVNEGGRYLLLIGELKGTANLADNLMVGTTFSILERDPKPGPVAVDEFLQPGTEQLSSGLMLFGVRTLLLLTTGQGVYGFVLDRNMSRFVLSNPKMQVPEDQNRYSIDPTQAYQWPPPIKRYIDECIQGEEGPRGKDFVMRWSPSLLVGVFRVINSGGLFLGPDVGRKSHLVRLSHTAAPLAFLVEQAGGLASTGTERIMSVEPESLDQKIAYYLGSAPEVKRVERYFDEFEKGLDQETVYPLFGTRSLFTT